MRMETKTANLDGAGAVTGFARRGTPSPCHFVGIQAADASVFAGLPDTSLRRPAGTDPRRMALDALPLAELLRWGRGGLELGSLILPTLRWTLRRHDLVDDEPTRRLVRVYLRSASALAHEFDAALAKERPRALVVFNGILFPEAVARERARRADVPVFTHEVGLRPFSAFFSAGEATFREVTLDRGDTLTEAEAHRLDEYLRVRFSGRFSMAGIDFWPEMQTPPACRTAAYTRARYPSG